jgi:altronate dehydratase
MITHSIWCSIPGVSNITATVLIAAGITIKSFLTGLVTTSQLEILQYPNGALIGARAKKIINSIAASASRQTTSIRILSAIPGISKATATSLVNNTLNGDLASIYDIDISVIINAKKGARQRIGKKLAERIVKLLNSC